MIPDDEWQPLHFWKLRPEDIAVWFDVPAHLVSDDLDPGYWERELARSIRRRSIRRRARRVLARMGRRIGRRSGE